MKIRHYFISALLASGLLCSSVEAQLRTDSILFEPVPIPDEPGAGPPLVPLERALESLRNDGSRELRLSARERASVETSIAEYVITIGDQEAEEGPYSDQLIEDLFAAGLLAQSVPDHERALNFFVRAQALIRINEGLETLNQLPMMRAIVASQQALNRLNDADETQLAILTLQQRNYGERSVAMVPGMMDFGTWHMDAFLERSNILLNIDRMDVTRFMTEPGNYIHQYDARKTPVMNLYQAQQTLLNAVDILVGNKEYFHPQILELERRLLTSYFLSMHREDIVYEPDFYLTRKKRKTGSRLNTNQIEMMESQEYRLGQASHQRAVTFISGNPDRDVNQLAQAMLEAADWHLLFERKVRAADEYQKAFAYFSADPALAAEALPVLYPQVPVVLPTYLPAPNSREKLNIAPGEPVSFFGYFDVSFSIDKFGKAKRIRVRDQAGDVTRNMETRLKEYLRRVLFRPRFKDGEPDTGTMNLRYYVGI